MSRWPTKKLGEVLKVQNGFAFDSELFTDQPDGMPIIRIRDLARGFTETFYHGAYAEKYVVNRGDLLIGMDGEFRCYRWPATPALLNQRICRLVSFSSSVCPDFVFYGINEYLAAIEANTGFSTVKHLSSRQVEQIELPFPPLPEQERIVRILDEAEALRRLRAQADKRTDGLVPALFEEMFGNLTSNPKGWPIRSLGDLLADGPQNGLYKHSSFYGEGTPILRIDAFYDGEVRDITALKRLRITQEESRRYQLRENDIVINRVNSPEYLGKSALIRGLMGPTVFESNMMRLAVSTSDADPVYIICLLQMPVTKQHVMARAKDAINQSSINQEDVKSLPVPLPPLSLQHEFAIRVAEIRELETAQAASRKRLAELFESLLHRAFQGEL